MSVWRTIGSNPRSISSPVKTRSWQAASLACRRGPGADAENFRQPRHDLRGLASQHPRLCFAIDEEQVNQLVIGVAAEVFEQDCLVRLSQQRAYVFQLHRLLNVQDSVLVGFQERRRVGHLGTPIVSLDSAIEYPS